MKAGVSTRRHPLHRCCPRWFGHEPEYGASNLDEATRLFAVGIRIAPEPPGRGRNAHCCAPAAQIRTWSVNHPAPTSGGCREHARSDTAEARCDELRPAEVATRQPRLSGPPAGSGSALCWSLGAGTRIGRLNPSRSTGRACRIRRHDVDPYLR